MLVHRIFCFCKSPKGANRWILLLMACLGGSLRAQHTQAHQTICSLRNATMLPNLCFLNPTALSQCFFCLFPPYLWYPGYVDKWDWPHKLTLLGGGSGVEIKLYGSILEMSYAFTIMCAEEKQYLGFQLPSALIFKIKS